MEREIVTVPRPDLVEVLQKAANDSGQNVLVICTQDLVEKCRIGIQAEEQLKAAGMRRLIPKRRRGPRKPKA